MSFRSSVSTVFLACAAACAFACADETNDDSTRTGVLVFRSGRVLEGEITETETHYVIVRKVGKIEVPKSEIETVAKDLDSVYRLMASRINDRDPDEHFKLAQWCVFVNLRERAIEELERTAALSGDSNRVKGMLNTLRRLPATDTKPKSPPAVAEIIESRAPLALPEHQPSERALTPAAVSAFTLQVQPMLTRSCATTGCHDSTHSGPLVLTRFTVTNQRTTHSNLRAVLSVIDAVNPDSSPLITMAGRSHPRDGRSPASNVIRGAAFATLVDWTRAVSGRPAGKTLVEPQSDEPMPGATDPTIKSADTPNSSVGGSPQLPGVESSPLAPIRPGATPPGQLLGAPHWPLGPAAAIGPRLSIPASPPAAQNPFGAPARAADDYKPIDPFDPEIFNRQFAPRGAGERP